METDTRTRAELLADLEIAREHAGRFKRAAGIIDDDLVEAALRARVRKLETLIAIREAKITGTHANYEGTSTKINTSFADRVTERFGVLPNFFRSKFGSARLDGRVMEVHAVGVSR